MFIIDDGTNVEGIEYTETAILVWVNAHNEEAAMEYASENVGILGFLHIQEFSNDVSRVFLLTYEGAANA